MEKRRTVIVTSFGIHDAFSLLQTSQSEEKEPLYAAALAACRDAAAHLTRHAAAGDSLLAPLVFLLQSSDVKPGGVERSFLEEVHRLQREEIGFGTGNEAGVRDKERETERRGQSERTTSDRDVPGDNQVFNGGSICDDSESRGVFLVEDARSKPQCIRRNTSSHFREHARVVEARMIWNLIKLVDREHDPSSANVQMNTHETGKATEPPWAARERNATASGLQFLGADAVWSRLQEAVASQDECLSPPCGQVSTTPWPTLRPGCLPACFFSAPIAMLAGVLDKSGRENLYKVRLSILRRAMPTHVRKPHDY